MAEKTIIEIMQEVNPDSDAAFWEDSQVRRVAELYHAQYQPPVPDEADAIRFHLWMKENDTPERAAEWFHYSDEDMYKVFKTLKP